MNFIDSFNELFVFLLGSVLRLFPFCFFLSVSLVIFFHLIAWFIRLIRRKFIGGDNEE